MGRAPQHVDLRVRLWPKAGADGLRLASRSLRAPSRDPAPLAPRELLDYLADLQRWPPGRGDRGVPGPLPPRSPSGIEQRCPARSCLTHSPLPAGGQIVLHNTSEAYSMSTPGRRDRSDSGVLIPNPAPSGPLGASVERVEKHAYLPEAPTQPGPG